MRTSQPAWVARLSAQTVPGYDAVRAASRTTGAHHFAAQNRFPYRRCAVAGAIPDPTRTASALAPVFHETGGDDGTLSAYRGTPGRTSGGRGRTDGARGGIRPLAGGARLRQRFAKEAVHGGTASLVFLVQTALPLADLCGAITVPVGRRFPVIRAPHLPRYRYDGPHRHMIAAGQANAPSIACRPPSSQPFGYACTTIAGANHAHLAPAKAVVVWRGGASHGVDAAKGNRGQGKATGGGRDKRAHIALRSVGCFCSAFRRLAHIAPLGGNVRQSLKPLYLRDLSHIAEPRHDR